MKGLKTMAKKKETEPKGTDKKNEKINGEKTDNVEIEVEKEVSEAESLASQLKDVNDRLLRTLAEYDNFRKRSQKEKEAAYSDSKALVLAELLPVMDNFERAAENKNASPEDYMKGIDMIYNQFSEVFKKLGVESFGEKGDSFDPNLHNAVMHEDDENEKDIKGYNFNYGEIWHTERDTYSKSIPEYQEHAATVMAIVTLGVANLEHLLSREGLYK